MTLALLIVFEKRLFGRFVRRPGNGQGRRVGKDARCETPPKSHESFRLVNIPGGLLPIFVQYLWRLGLANLFGVDQTGRRQGLRLQCRLDAIERSRDGGCHKAGCRAGQQHGHVRRLFVFLLLRVVHLGVLIDGHKHHSVRNIRGQCNWETTIQGSHGFFLHNFGQRLVGGSVVPQLHALLDGIEWRHDQIVRHGGSRPR
mmetsp:Transcript_9377/g.20246  ORF Transcript_9377/g.20246 Transcript_9377/m.20246 type:complete len:200 (-) Transcript_9377:140-739(-)